MSPDTVTMTPPDDLLVAEDRKERSRLIGITPEGGAYVFALNRLGGSEFAGPCFAPDGRTAFVDIQDPGMTIAICGPFADASVSREAAMAAAGPLRSLAPTA